MAKRKRKCVVFGCESKPLKYLRVGQSMQTNNGHFTITISGWYCPNCGGGYGK